ncbi:hypothetical protein AtEden1_Chr2g0248041 [Arabidopsis thaliana]
MFNTRVHIVIITLNLLFLYAGGRLIPLESVPSSSMMPLSVEDTVKLNPRNQIFHGTQVKSCMPKGFRPRSAPSRFKSKLLNRVAMEEEYHGSRERFQGK